MYLRHNRSLRGLSGQPEGTTEADPSRVLMYEKGNYRGKVWPLGVGTHTYHTKAFTDNRVSSIKVPAGLVVTLFEHGTERGSGRGKSYGRALRIEGPMDIPMLREAQYKFEDLTSRVIVTAAAGTVGAPSVASGPDARMLDPSGGEPGSTRTAKVCPQGQVFDPTSGLCIAPFGTDTPTAPMDVEPSSAPDVAPSMPSRAATPVVIGVAAVAIGAAVFLLKRRG